MTVTYDYTGKVVLVTGGTKGIGAGIAAAFHAAGATVIVCARTAPPGHGTPPGPNLDLNSEPDSGPGPNPAPGSSPIPEIQDISGTPGIRFVQADVRVPEDVERLVSGLDRLDVLVNNAGGTPHAPLDGTSPRLHARIIELNLTAPLLLSQRAHPLLAAARGSIVMIGSSSGARPSPGTTAYGAAKAGLHHLARCLAAEWAPEIRVNTVVVGLVASETAAEHYGDQAGLGATIPAGRMATPADVAQACLWLAAPGYVTGAEVRVDGGGETPAWRHLTPPPTRYGRS
ncbi:SDR family oxidoreductase [Nonomuraea sp. NPDC046802]|uniref:SDR family oxidoreductase n=1 Tax=Nonomuraea sp. NPDC046802 TaxID=3154919 RepID=UPI0033FD30EA